MSLLDLKNKLFCNKTVGFSNFSAKATFDALTKQFNLPNIPSFASVKAQIAKLADDQIADIKKTVTNAKDSLVAEFNKLEGEYNTAKDILKDVKGKIGELFSTCEVAENNDTKNPKINPVADTLSTPSTNDDELATISTDTKIKKDTENSKSQGINETTDNITKVNKELSTMGILEARTYVKQYSNPHPVLNNYVSQLSYFRPISPVVGESFFGYIVDKPSLQISEWKENIATCLRKSTKEKMRSEIASEIQTNYTNLNKQFTSNISNEFFEERKSVPLNTAHPYHLAGDSLFAYDHMASDTSLMKALNVLLTTVLGDQIVLVNYLLPIKEQLKNENDIYKANIESNTVIINKRNDIVRKPFTSVNNNVLKPKALTEE
jgi:hypothetical protein